MRFDERLEVWAADLLFALDQDFQVDGQLTSVPEHNLERFDVRIHLPFVIGAAPCDDLAIAHNRGKWVSSPLADWVNGLHVVMPVQQHRRRTHRLELFGVNHRMPGRLEDLGDEANPFELFVEPLSGSAHVACPFWQRADAGDRQPLEQFGLGALEVVVGHDGQYSRCWK